MMTDEGAAECQWVIDCSGLHEIATTKSNNLRQLFFDSLANGLIAVPTIVLKEFRNLYATEAALIEPIIAVKINQSRRIELGAARIAERLNSGFSRGVYDENTDIYTASIATIDDYVLLTATDQSTNYDRMGCDVQDLAKWISENK